MSSKRNIKRGLIGVVSLVLLVLIGGWCWSWLLSQPLYAVGDVAKGKNLRGALAPPEQVEASHWQVEPDIRLAYDVHGEGTPVVVVHGGPGIPYREAWSGLERLEDRFRFYYPHQRGSGESTRPFDRFSVGNYYENMTELEQTLGLGAQIADIERIRRILGRDKITLIGHSFGGLIATLYAAEFPERVDRLILVAPAGMLTPPNEERNLFELVRAELGAEDRPEFDALMIEYLDFGSLFSKSSSELIELQERVGEFILRAMGYDPSSMSPGTRIGGWTAFAMYFSCGTAQDFRPALRRLKAKTLIIVGEDDRMSLPGARSYEPIEGARFVIVERDPGDRRSGHFVFEDSPEGFCSAVEKFLAFEVSEAPKPNRN